MSTITFQCNEAEKTILKAGLLEIITNHYFTTVRPNTNAKYENEGEAVYRDRLGKLVNDRLCSFEETDEGMVVEFDSTEDAGFAIADEVYHTSMGYSDNGLTWIDPLFQSIVSRFPNIAFEADTECADSWVYEESHYSYDGEVLTKDGEELEDDPSASAVDSEEDSPENE